MSAIGSVDGLALLGLIGGQVGFGNQSAIGLHRSGQFSCGLALVETVAAFLLDALERFGQVGLLPDFTRLVGRAAFFEKLLRAGRVPGKILFIKVKLARQAFAQRKTFLRQLDGRFEQVLHLFAAEPLMGKEEAGDRSRHAHGQIAFVVGRLGVLAVCIEEHVFGGRRRGLFAEVEGGDFALSRADNHEPPAADVARRRQSHRQGEPGGDGGVHRVAALLENFHTCL